MTVYKRIAVAAVGVTVLSLVSKILGFVREMVVAAYFGTSMEADAYQIATAIPMIIFDAFATAVALTFVPLYTDILTNKGEKEAGEFTRNLAGVMTYLMLGLVIISLLTTPLLVSVVAPGFFGEKRELAIQLSRILLPVIIFRVLSGIASGLLNSNQSFFIPAAVGFALNGGIIGTVVMFAGGWGVKALAWGTFIGIAGMLLIQLPKAVDLGFKLKALPAIGDPNIKKLLLLSVPVFFSSAVNQLSTLVDRIMASTLPTGAISALTYALRLNGFVLGIFVASVATVFFPAMSKMAAEGRPEEFKATFCTAVKMVILFVLPMMAGLIVLNVPIVRVLFERGAFDVRATGMTAIALFMFAFGLVGFSLKEILNRVFYSLQDTRTPTVNAIVAVGVNIILNLILIWEIGHAGLALATSLSATLTAVLLFISLWRKLGPIGGFELLGSFARMFLAAAGMGLIAYYFNRELPLLAHGKLGETMHLFSVISISAAGYFILAYLLGVKEVKLAIRSVGEKLHFYRFIPAKRSAGD